jgi:DNA-binding ferritin-like protein (Dps family)
MMASKELGSAKMAGFPASGEIAGTGAAEFILFCPCLMREMEERRNLQQAVSEAENAPTQFPAKERATYVADMIRRVEIYQVEGKNKEQIRELMPDFSKSYKELFDMVTRPGGYDKNTLKVMIQMLNQMGNGNMSQHQASVIVGKKLVDTYVKPQTEGANRNH